MSKVGIITDSIHGLPDEIIKRYNIQIAPMGVIINNKAYRDTFDITSKQFYALFKEARTPSTTNAATPGDFLNIYSSLYKGTDSMIYIGVSKALTATYNVAQQTRELFIADHPGTKIELVDSKNCMGALGFLVLEAAKAAEGGGGLTEIVKIIQNMMPKVKYLSILDTLRYLIKIGRLPKTAASDEKLRFRPVIGMTNNSGVMENFPPVEVEQAVEKLVELAGKYFDSNRPAHAIIHHSEYLEEAEQLKQMVISRFKPVEIYLSEYSPAALSSTGLMTGISFYS